MFATVLLVFLAWETGNPVFVSFWFGTAVADFIAWNGLTHVVREWRNKKSVEK